jgi:hypothetical protein
VRYWRGASRISAPAAVGNTQVGVASGVVQGPASSSHSPFRTILHAAAGPEQAVAEESFRKSAAAVASVDDSAGGKASVAAGVARSPAAEGEVTVSRSGPRPTDSRESKSQPHRRPPPAYSGRNS